MVSEIKMRVRRAEGEEIIKFHMIVDKIYINRIWGLLDIGVANSTPNSPHCLTSSRDSPTLIADIITGLYFP